MSRIHVQQLGLEDLVRQAGAIVIAAPLDPFEHVIEYAIGDEENPYVVRAHRYRLWEILRNTGRHSSSGEHAPDEPDMGELLLDHELEVFPGRVSFRYDRHVEYHVKGISRSWSEERFESPSQVDPEKERIIFMDRIGFLKKSVWSYTLPGSMVPTKLRKKVDKLVSKLPD